MPKKIIRRQCSSQKSLASMHGYEGHFNQECTRSDIPDITTQKRKKIYKACRVTRSMSKHSKIQKRSYDDVEVGPSDYIFYSVLNTNYNTDRGSAAAAIARSLLALYKKLDSNNILGYYVDKWMRSGENIIVLKGFDHKHLKYLYDEVKYVAIDVHLLHRRWSCGRDILVLTAFGQQEDLEDIFQGLLPLR